MKNLPIIILAIIFTIVNIINAGILNTIFWIDIVHWNYEFTKTLSFNILFWLFSFFFIIFNFRKKFFIPKIVYVIFGIFVLSILFSSYTLTNIFWNDMKWHWIMFLSNLVILYTIISNIEKNRVEKLIKYIIILSPLVFLLTIWEYHLNVWNREFWFFWHQTYLALYWIMLLPFILKRITLDSYKSIKENQIYFRLWRLEISKNFFIKSFYILIFILLTLTLFLTKSILAIIIFVAYLTYFFTKDFNLDLRKKIYLINGIVLIIIISILTKAWMKENISSLISKILTWQSTYNIISKSVDFSFFGVWADSLYYTFEAYKSNLLYIFEWIWYNTDRPQNFVLEIFYSFWVLGFWVFIFAIFNFFSEFKNKTSYHTILIFLIYTFFSFSSVVNYFYLVIIIALISNKWEIFKDYFKTKILFLLISIFSIIASLSYYYEETKYFLDPSYSWNNQIYNYLKLENKEEYIIRKDLEPSETCQELLKINKSAEIFLDCWNFMWFIGDYKLAYIYYEKWLEKLPNVWKKDSETLSNIFLNYFFSEKKFFDEDKSNISEILEIIENKNHYLKTWQ